MKTPMKKRQEPLRPLEDTKPIIIPDDQLGPRLELGDESASGGFEPISPNDAWEPGLIEVVFKQGSQSGVQDWNFLEEKEREQFSGAWSDGLKNLVIAHKLVSWKPSFPLLYPWSTESSEKARENYKRSGRDRFVTFNFPLEAFTRRIADELRQLPEIEQAVAVPRIRPPSGPFDEPLIGTSDQPMNTVCRPNGCLTSQWYLFRCRVDQAWSKAAASGKGVTIAVIDWGFNRNHQDLAKQVKKTRHVLPIPVPDDTVNHGGKTAHGTAVLGLAAAEVNSQGMAGIAFGAELWAIQAGTDTIIDHSLWVRAINFVCTEPSNGRKILILEIQTEIGGNIEMIPTIAEEIRRAIRDHNIVVCVPAGNRSGDAGTGDDNNPIPCTGSILVGATRFDEDNNILGSSKGGSRVVVYAPGDVSSDLTCGFVGNDGYRNGFGMTSGAVAKVAGVAALMLEKNSGLTHQQIRDILRQSQIPVVNDPGTKVGVLLDAEQAVCEALRRAGGSCL